jgi:hypothetical protein
MNEWIEWAKQIKAAAQIGFFAQDSPPRLSKGRVLKKDIKREPMWF